MKKAVVVCGVWCVAVMACQKPRETPKNVATAQDAVMEQPPSQEPASAVAPTPPPQEDAAQQKPAFKTVEDAFATTTLDDADLWMAAYYGSDVDYRTPYCEHALATGELEHWRDAILPHSELSEAEQERLQARLEATPRSDDELLKLCHTYSTHDDIMAMPRANVKGADVSFRNVKLKALETHVTCSRKGILKRIEALHDARLPLSEDSLDLSSFEASGERRPYIMGFEKAVARLETIQKRCEEMPDELYRQAILSYKPSDDEDEDDIEDQYELAHLKAMSARKFVQRVFDAELKSRKKWATEDDYTPCSPKVLAQKKWDRLRCKGDAYDIVSASPTAADYEQLFTSTIDPYDFYAIDFEGDGSQPVALLSTLIGYDGGDYGYGNWAEECDECEDGRENYWVRDINGQDVISYFDFGGACPFVYTQHSAGGWSYRGEILRNLRRASLEETQTLDVSIPQSLCDAPTFKVRLTEEKQEVTYLDSVALLAGGQRVLPMACTANQDYCRDDGSYYMLKEGDVLDVEFDWTPSVKEACRRGDFRLEANGYYIPTH